jgi:hypothetical protein
LRRPLPYCRYHCILAPAGRNFNSCSSNCLRSTKFKEHSSFESAGFGGIGIKRMIIKRLAIKRTILPGTGLIIPLGKDL